jgi:DNA helicase IV
LSHVKVITQSKVASTSAAESAHDQASELTHEQDYVTMLYERLDVLRAATQQQLRAVQLDPTAENDQGWSERESFVEQYRNRAAELEAAERNLCFGRLDFDDGARFYVGRLGLRGDDHDRLLVDWRARAAEPFYRATARERYDVIRRRHLHTTGRRVVSLDDDVLDLAAVDQTQLTGEAALLASLSQTRTGRMGDIVATIQADQDRIIRAGRHGILVVEGGPGTGKTVVALHRAAYLLYTYRKQLARRGILIIGPNATFLHYIDQVLPSLGETDVVLGTVGSLFPGVNARDQDSSQAARVKGNIKMAGVLAQAVIDLRQVPAAVIEIKIDGITYRLSPRLLGLARAEAERRVDPDTDESIPHNSARRVFINEVVRALARQRARDLGGRGGLQPGDEEDLRAELATAPALRSVLDVLWPELEPQQLLAQLFREPSRLDLPDDERAAIARDEPRPWTQSDVPLLDELAELVGTLDATEREARRRRAAEQAEQAESLQYARQLVTQLAEDQAIVLPPLEFNAFVTWVGNRNFDSEPDAVSADRSPHDRNPAYGHVIVDEAQELSAMAWRMVLRRCPARSMTIVGDLAQTSTPSGADSWAQVLDPVAPGRWRTARLTVNYRTPKPVMAVATTLLPPAADPPVSVRDSDEPPWYAHVEWPAQAKSLVDLVAGETELVGTGRVAVIVPPARLDEVAATLKLAPGPDLDAPVAVLTPEQAKGLEFDSVVIVDPAGIEQASPRGRAELYVALTRTTRRLGLIGTDRNDVHIKKAMHLN